MKRPLPLAILLFLIITFAHFASLPLLITWDGLQYIDLADVLGSDRFPKDWAIIRAPLFPLALKLAFAVFGRNPLAAKAVPLSMAVLGCLALASGVRQVAGERAAAVSLVLLALYPTLIVFEHMILTETGTFFFLALAIRLSLWSPETPSAAWKKALSLGLVLAVGYYWRQTLLLLAPWFALLHVLSVRNLFRGRRGWGLAVLQAALLVAVLPWGLARLWSARFDPAQGARLEAVVVRKFVLRQAVIPPEDARVARVRNEYQAAIVKAEQKGFLSGIPWPEASRIGNKLPLPTEGAFPWFAAVIREYPGRYAAAIGRGLLFFVGLDAAENEIAGLRTLALSPVARNSLIGAGPQGTAERAKQEFSLSTGPGLLKSALGVLGSVFDWLLILCNLMTVGMLAAALVGRDDRLLAFSGTPVVFALAHAAMLMSINRLMVPVYPITLACGVVACFRLGHFLRTARARGEARNGGIMTIQKSSRRILLLAAAAGALVLFGLLYRVGDRPAVVPYVPPKALPQPPPKVPQVDMAKVLPGLGYGNLDGATLADDGSVFLWGWAFDPRSGTPARAVILTDNEQPLSLLIPVSVERPDVVAAKGKPQLLRSGWNIRLPASGRDRPHVFEAYAVFADGKLGRLGRSPSVGGPPGR